MPAKKHFSVIAIVIVLAALATGLRIWATIGLTIFCLLTIFHFYQSKFTKGAIVPMYILPVALWLWQCFALLYSPDHHFEVENIVRSLVLVAVPFCFVANDLITKKQLIACIFLCFTVLLTVVILICFCFATAGYLANADKAGFFYHQLLQPFGIHAVYFSAYILACFFYWRHQHFLLPATFRRLLIFCVSILVAGLLLLASKLCLIFFLIWLLYNGFKKFWLQQRRYIFFGTGQILIILLLIFTTNNPIRQRFADVQFSRTWHMKEKQFSANTYLDGVALRVFLWRASIRILNQNNAWLRGVSAAGAQPALNKMYQQSGLYLGDGKEDNGYTAFNCHNSFLQIMLQHGLVGLLLFVSTLLAFFRAAMRQKNDTAITYLIFVTCFCFTESLVSIQAGLLLLILLPYLLIGKQLQAAE